MTENEAIKTDEELGCEIACEVIAKANEKSIEFETKIMDVTLGRWGYCKNDIEKALTELEEYRKLGTVEEVREAVDKTKALKPKKKKMKRCYDYHCAKCGKRFISKDDSGWYCGEFEKFCSDCGTPVDWSGQRLESEE